MARIGFVRLAIIFSYCIWRLQGRRRAYLCDRLLSVFGTDFDALLSGYGRLLYFSMP
jgi:hypothetical protein